MGQTNFILLVMYDISTLCSSNAKEYRKLYHYLQRQGFYPLQASVYLKPLSEKRRAQRFIAELSLFRFENAHLRAIILTYSAFLEMNCIMGGDTLIEKLLKQPNGVLIV